MRGRLLDRVARGVFALVFLVSLVILFSPASAVPQAPPGVDKIVHFTLFAALTVTAVAAGLPRAPAGLLALGYAAVSEVLQTTVPGLNRSGSVLDWLADAAGVVAGVLASGVLAEARPRPPRG